MSSTVSILQLRSIPPKAAMNNEVEDKQHRLVRSSSIDKIRRFNSFICSQHYYILPAILSWLRSSHSGLQSSTEKTIFLFRSIIFNTLLYRMFIFSFKSSDSLKTEILLKNVKVVLAWIIANFYEKFSQCFESTFLLVAAVYTACVIVVFQLSFALYLIYSIHLPYGFMFLIGCMLTINYLCYRTLFFHCKANKHKRDIKHKNK